MQEKGRTAGPFVLWRSVEPPVRMRYNAGMNKDEFKSAMAAQGHPVSEEQLDQLEAYKDLLLEWNKVMNLTAITEEGQIWEKHFYDSVCPFLKEDFETLCDVGSGAGFPGIPVQILWPEKKITLVEPLQKRCRFLNEVKEKLGLEHLEVVNARAEDFAAERRESFDAASARAVARLALLLELTAPLVKKGGRVIALKGRTAREELQTAQKALRELGLKLEREEDFLLHDEQAERINLYFDKVRSTPARYPRPFAQMKKKPLEGA